MKNLKAYSVMFTGEEKDHIGAYFETIKGTPMIVLCD